MMAVFRLGAAALAFGVFLAPAAWADDDLALSGPGGQSATLSAADIAALPHVKLTVTIEGKTATYDGVPLEALLERVGAPSGKALRGPALRDIVVVSGRDGYAAALALAETDPAMRKEQVLLADRMDGQPLAPSAGPWRLVVEGDQRAARCVRMVAKIAVAPAP
jgi:DMSO/TMAO reductase YedYZ molybdopterin-dependent catalytic subunit